MNILFLGRFSRSGKAIGIGVIAIATSTIATAEPPLPAALDDGFMPKRNLPNAVMVLPLRYGGDVLKTGGWKLSFVNHELGPETPSVQHFKRQLLFDTLEGVSTVGTIRWDIRHTPNNGCHFENGSGCPDEIRILEVPPGFRAVPSRIVVPEKGSVDVFIEWDLSG